MFELSHRARIGMMRLASGRPVRHRDMVLGSGLAPSEVTRHVGRLLDIGVLKKNRDGSFEITRFGKLILERLDSLEYTVSNSQYFERHDMEMIPPGFDAVSMLQRTEKIEGAMDVFNAILRVNIGAHHFINSIQAEFSDALILAHVEKLRSGVELNMLVKGGKRLPTEYMDNRAAAISVRAAETIPYFYTANESEALVCFNGPGNKIDYSVGFRSSDPAFLEWCDVLFDRYWMRGRNVAL